MRYSRGLLGSKLPALPGPGTLGPAAWKMLVKAVACHTKQRKPSYKTLL